MMLSSPASSLTHARELEVRLLVDMVRLSRVTLLIGESGAEKSALLESSVVPLLTDSGPAGTAEVAVLFDAWDKAPLPALHARIREIVAASGTAAEPQPHGNPQSLVASLRAWQEALTARFVIIFDRFEEYLRMPAGRVGFAEFEQELVQAVNDPTLRANFLLSLDDNAEPLLLARLRDRIPRLGYSRVRLPHASQPAPVRPPERASAAQGSPTLSMHIAPVPAAGSPIVPTSDASASNASTPTNIVPASMSSATASTSNATASTSNVTARTSNASAGLSASEEFKARPTSIEMLAAAKSAKDAGLRARRPASADSDANAPTLIRPSSRADASPGRADKTVDVSPTLEVADASALQPAKPVAAALVQPPKPVEAASAQITAQAKAALHTIRGADAQKPRPQVQARETKAPLSRETAQALPTARIEMPTPRAEKPARPSEALPAEPAKVPLTAARIPGHRVTRFAWVPIALAVFAVFLFLQPKTQQFVERAASALRGSGESARPEQAAAEAPATRPEPTRQSAAPAVQPETTKPQIASVAPALSATPTPATQEAESTQKTTPSTPVVTSERTVTPKPAAVTPAQSAREAGTATKSAPLAAPRPSRQVEAAPQATRAIESPREVTAPSRFASAPAPGAQRLSRSPDSASASTVAPTPQQVGRPSETRPIKPPLVAVVPPRENASAAKPPPAVAVAPPVAEAPSGPTVYIHVRNEAQRAWAEKMVRPLGERGIRVGGIRMVTSGPDEADIRYYHLAQRDEAVKVAVALRDFGVRAQHLRHMEEPVTPPPRQYEIWLPPTGYDQKP